MTEHLASSSSDAYTPEDFITGEKQVVTDSIVVEDGEGVLPQYSVMGRVTATDEYKLSLSGASDGSEVPECITANSCDATSAAQNVGAYFEGCFNPDLLNIGAGHDIDSVKAAFLTKGQGIYLKTPG